MREKIVYILIALITFSFTYFLTFQITEKVNVKATIKKQITEEDLLETIRLSLDSQSHHYFDWESRKTNEIEILCQSNDKILFNIDLEEINERIDDPKYFYDYRKIYMGLEKINNYYFGDYFAGDDLLEEIPLDKERYCE